MTSSAINELATLLAPKPQGLVMHRATVTAVSSTTATILYAGTTIPNVPFPEHVTPTNGDIVDILIAGTAPRIVGVSA